MAVKLLFKNDIGESFYLPLIPMKVTSDNTTTPFTLYEDAISTSDLIPNKPTYEEVGDTVITKYYTWVENSNITLSITFTKGRSQAGYNKVFMKGSLRLNNSITGIYIGEQYDSPVWTSGTGSLEADYTGVQLLGYDSSRKLIIATYLPYATYVGGFANPGETKIRFINSLCNKKGLAKGTYQINGIRVGSQIITGNEYITEPIGSTISHQCNFFTNKDFEPTLWDEIFNHTKLPSYPDQDPDDDEPDGQPEPDPGIPGDGDTSSDPIPDPPPPPIYDVSDTGFVVIYNPSVIEIRQLAYFMWSGDFADLIKKVFAEPFAALISLKMLFCPITAGAKQTVWLGNVETTVSMSKVTKQFADVDLGSIQVTEFFGSFADYAPFTKIQIFLPFIGFKDLNTDEVMNSTLHLRYRVDVYSGACIAFLTVTKNIKSTNLNSILYQFDGNCALEIPFTSNDNSRYVSAILNTAASSALSLANTSSFTSAQSPFMYDKGENAQFQLGSLAPVANGMLDIMSAKPNVQRAGSLAGATAAMAIKQPYLIIHRPIQHMPANYTHYIGIPLNLSRQLSSVKGYTIVSQIFIASSTATDEEITQITQLLKSGVIL